MIINNWIMKYDNYDELACKAPCSMYGVLYEKGLIPDPFDGLNEQKLIPLSDKDCEFYTEFTADEILEKEHAELVFYGLDTI